MRPRLAAVCGAVILFLTNALGLTHAAEISQSGIGRHLTQTNGELPPTTAYAPTPSASNLPSTHPKHPPPRHAALHEPPPPIQEPYPSTPTPAERGLHPPPRLSRASKPHPPPLKATSAKPPPAVHLANNPPSDVQPPTSVAAFPPPGPASPLPPGKDPQSKDAALTHPSTPSLPSQAPEVLPPGILSPPTGTPETPGCKGIICSPAADTRLQIALIYTGYAIGFQFYTLDSWLSARARAFTAAANAARGASSAAMEGVSAMTKIANFARVLGPILGGLGPALAISVLFLTTDNIDTQLLTNGFADISQQTSDIATQLDGITNVFQGTDAVQTYIQDREELVNINTTLTALLRAPTVTTFSNMKTACDTASITPKAWMDLYEINLSADGSCSGGDLECILDPDAGIAKLIGYNRFTFLSVAILFLNDAAMAANLAVSCQAVHNVSTATVNATRDTVSAQYITIVNNIEKYYSGPMATAFWSTQFIQDTHQLMTASTNNSGTATALWSLLSSKYDQMRWGVAVWNGVTGSQYQGEIAASCDITPPPATCTATGGAYHDFRFPTGNSQTSFMIFFSPGSEPSLQPQFAAIQRNVAACSAYVPQSIWTQGSMLDQVTCLNSCDDSNGGCAARGKPQAEVRAALAVRFGNGLRAFYEGDSIIFLNQTTSSNCTTAYSDCPSDLPEISVMALPVAPS